MFHARIRTRIGATCSETRVAARFGAWIAACARKCVRKLVATRIAPRMRTRIRGSVATPAAARGAARIFSGVRSSLGTRVGACAGAWIRRHAHTRSRVTVRLLALLALCAAQAAAQCQLASDNFARPSLGANWTTEPGSAGTLDIVSSTAVGVTSGTVSGHSTIYWNAAAFNPSQYSAITLSALGNSNVYNLLGPAVLADPSSLTHYNLVTYAGTLYLQKNVTGTITNVANAGYTPAVGDTIQLSVTVTTTAALVASVNGATLLSYTDSSSPILTGAPGINGALYNSAQTPYLATPWTAGNLANCPCAPSLTAVGAGVC